MCATLLGLDRLGTSVEAILGYSFMLAGALLVVKGWVRICFSNGALVSEGIYGIPSTSVSSWS
jgi:hypothetical protein